MKVTLQLPDELYRRVKAKSALEGRPVRAVVDQLLRRYVAEQTAAPSAPASSPSGAAVPSWFGMLRQYADAAPSHDMESIAHSIGRGIAAERQP